MLNSFNEREQLARLHDRHKHFSLEVYNHHTEKNEEKLKEAQQNLKTTEKELKDLMKKVHP